jgi:hypothetical protein
LIARTFVVLASLLAAHGAAQVQADAADMPQADLGIAGLQQLRAAFATPLAGGFDLTCASARCPTATSPAVVVEPGGPRAMSVSARWMGHG